MWAQMSRFKHYKDKCWCIPPSGLLSQASSSAALRVYRVMHSHVNSHSLMIGIPTRINTNTLFAKDRSCSFSSFCRAPFLAMEVQSSAVGAGHWSWCWEYQAVCHALAAPGMFIPPCMGHEVSHFDGHDPLSLSHAGSKTSSSSWTQNLTQADSVAAI